MPQHFFVTPQDYNSVVNMQAVPPHLPEFSSLHADGEYVLQLSLEYDSIIGVYKRERITPQKIVIEMMLSLKEPLSNQQQQILKANVEEIATSLKPQLLEKMAIALKTMLTEQLLMLTHAAIVIKKPAALKYARCSYVHLILDRRQS